MKIQFFFLKKIHICVVNPQNYLLILKKGFLLCLIVFDISKKKNDIFSSFIFDFR